MPNTVSQTLLDVPATQWDPWALENLENPYPMYEAVRNSAPVLYMEKHRTYLVARHEEVAQVLQDYKRFTLRHGSTIYDTRKPGNFRVPNLMQDQDPPKHTQIRGVAAKIMSPIVIRRMREAFERQADTMAREIVAKGEVDGVDEITVPFVISAFPDAVGVKLRRKEALIIADMRFNQSCPPNELYFKAMEAAQPYLGWFDEACKRENLVPNSIAEQLYQAEDAKLLEPGVASSIVRSLVGGGVDSTISAIGHTLHQLARDRAIWALIKDDPKRLRPAFEESIRLETPFQYTWRTVVEQDVELSGYHLDRDVKVTIMLGAANRDPRRWSHPDTFDLNRDTVGNYVGFGLGDHNCIGQMIARAEADSILAALVRHAATMELNGDPKYHLINQMRNLGSLPLRFTPA
jgi:cytochrome P450